MEEYQKRMIEEHDSLREDMRNQLHAMILCQQPLPKGRGLSRSN